MLAITEKHIRAYNALDGKPANRAQLQALHDAIARDVKAGKVDKFSPLGIEVFGIRSRLAKALKGEIDQDIVRVKQIDINAYLKIRTAAKPKVITRTIVKTVVKKLPPEPKAAPMDLGFTAEGQASIYEIVNKMILKELSKSGLFWRKTWSVKKVDGISTLAQNFKTKTVYTGINYWTTNFIARSYGCVSPFFLSVQQVNEMGGAVKKGAKLWPILFYTFLYELQKPTKKKITEEEYRALTADERKDVKTFPVVQYYNVVNADHIEGITFPPAVNGPAIPEPQKIESCERIVKGMPKRPQINHGGDEAYYSPSSDKIQMPPMKYFDKEQEYYGTLFHEMGHSTGHQSRIGRSFKNKFGSKEYAFEELIAELGASYLCAEAGTLYFTLKNSAAYLKGWASKLTTILKGDDKFFVQAAAGAQKSANYILNVDADEASEGLLVKDQVAAEENLDTQTKGTSNKKASKGKAVMGVLSGADIAAMEFKKIDLSDEWKAEFGEIASDEQMMFWGSPGSGKTYRLLKFAKYLAHDKNMRGVFIANEELGRSTFTKKINQLKQEGIDVNDPNLDFAKKIPEDVSGYEFILFDSINSLHMTLDDYIKFRDEHGPKIYISIVQTTKDGDFRGGKDWEHEMDFAGEYNDRKLIVHKNRHDPDFNRKRDELMIDAKVKEAKEKEMIKKKVKEQTGPIEQPQTKAA